MKLTLRNRWFLRAVLFALFAASSLAAIAQEVASPWAIEIRKSEIGPKAKFFAYTVNGRPMEVFAVKASDGTIRTALNTCQVCYASGRGYYVQEGQVLVCQNCGNRFRVDQVEKVKGGCNPIPILGKDKTDLGDSLGISKAYLESVAPYFARWKR